MTDEKPRRKLPPRGAKVNGTRLRELREAHAWNQAELARRAKLSRATLSRAESGGQVSFAAIRALAKVLQVSHKELIAGADVDDEEEDGAA